jgi:hypothetical protein
MTDVERILWLILWFGAFMVSAYAINKKEEKCVDDADKQLQRNFREVQLRRKRREYR